MARLTLDGLYRVTYGESPGLTWEEMKARLPLKFELMLPGNPTPKDYKIVNMSPYKIHRKILKLLRLIL